MPKSTLKPVIKATLRPAAQRKNRSYTPSLPLEIIELILSHIPLSYYSQPTLHACTLVSRAWYSASIARLYEKPIIIGKNYDLFVTSVCPSINANIRKNGLAELVKTLDLSRLVHHGSKSLTARLLGRVKAGIEVFTAPQASFGINALSALAKCSRLRRLDMSLVSVAFTTSELAHSLRKLTNLDTLLFPRAGNENHERLSSCWPECLKTCIITGGLMSRYYTNYQSPTDPGCTFPKRRPHNLTRLTIGNCDKLRPLDIESIIFNLPNLDHLEIKAPMSQLQETPMEYHFLALATFRHLKIPVNYISPSIFGCGIMHPHPDGPEVSFVLDTLELDCIEPRGSRAEQIDVDRIWDAVAEGALGNLRRVKLHRRLIPSSIPEVIADATALDQYLKTLASEDGEKGRFKEEEAGVWIFGE